MKKELNYLQKKVEQPSLLIFINRPLIFSFTNLCLKSFVFKLIFAHKIHFTFIFFIRKKPSKWQPEVEFVSMENKTQRCSVFTKPVFASDWLRAASDTHFALSFGSTFFVINWIHHWFVFLPRTLAPARLPHFRFVLCSETGRHVALFSLVLIDQNTATGTKYSKKENFK